MIRHSIFAALLALIVSLFLHVTGLAVLFQPGTGSEEQAAPEPADSAAFEDFVSEALEPDEPEPTPEVEPEEIVEPIPTTDAQVASDTPQDTVSPDSGEEAEALGRVEPDTEVVAAEPPSQGTDAPVPEGTPEAAPETAQVEAQELEDAQEADAPEETIEALTEEPEIEIAPEETQLASAVTRSLRPPPQRPSAEAFGALDGAEDAQDQPGQENAPALSQRTGLDLLAEAGSAALYGRQSLNQARAAGNAATTNYAGEVLMRLNRTLRVYRNEQGSAVVRFQIAPDGSIGWVRIIRSRGTPGIEVAAAAQVRAAAPFARPPGGQPVELMFTYQNR